MKKLTYKSTGVDKEAGYESVEKIKHMVRSTYSPLVLGDLGSFGGSIEIPEGYKKPVLVSGTDGVGTKLMIAHMTDVHTSVGQDLVAMCTNDVLCSGAKPLFFLDYIACGKNDPERIADIVKGIADGCLLSECSLIGGETAEMPGMYDPGEYDLAGFCCGIAEKDEMLTGDAIKEGDVLIGLASSGAHSNGFSLLRKAFFELNDYQTDSYIPEFGRTLGEELLTPTAIYVKDVLALMGKIKINGMCHITGGGFIENVPRMIPNGLCALIDTSAITTPAIFEFLMKSIDIEREEMYATFNMGIGFMIAVGKDDADKALEILSSFTHDPVVIGRIEKGKDKVKLCL